MFADLRTIARSRNFFALFTAAFLIASPARAELIYGTVAPGGVFGYWGFDVFAEQSVGIRITPDADYTLDEIKLWFMNNDFSGVQHPLVRISLRPDDQSTPGVSIPGTEIIESYAFNVSAVGWDPVLETVDSQTHPRLCAGVNYWIVATSLAPPGENGVWVMAAEGIGFSANTDQDATTWQPGGTGAAPGAEIHGTPLLAGDVNADGAVNGLDVIRFTAAVLGNPVDPADVTRSDMNCDGAANLDDVELFVAAVLG